MDFQHQVSGAMDNLFVPASSHLVESGAHTRVRDWIVLGVLNGLVVALSHLIFAFYAILGPLAFLLDFYHQSVENILIASVYLLMAVTAPCSRPYTINAVVLSIVALMMGWWPFLPVAVPAGFLADLSVRRIVPRHKWKLLVLVFALYTTLLAAANYWPFLFLKQSAMMQRLLAVDPGMAGMVKKITLPFFLAQLSSAFVTGLLGGAMAIGLIIRHFPVERVNS